MKMPWTNKTGLAKAAVILTFTFLLSLGLFGAHLYFDNRGGGDWLLNIELMGMVASLFGLSAVGAMALLQWAYDDETGLAKAAVILAAVFLVSFRRHLMVRQPASGAILQPGMNED